MIRASAPGKLVLIGEYAVLGGAPAAVMAVDRRARVEIVPSAGDRWSLAAPGLAPEPAEFSIDPGGRLIWEEDGRNAGERFGLVEAVVRGLTGAGVLDPAGLSPAAATLDTRAFFHDAGSGRDKLGLGSSAALTVALASALVAWAGEETPPNPQWLQALVNLHRGVQGGRGSGIDIAASLLGGVLRYQLDHHGQVSSAVPLRMPDELHVLGIWTGRSASTGEFLKRLEVCRREDPRAVEETLGRLGAISEDGIVALEDSCSAAFLGAIGAFWQGLEDLGRVVGLPILSAEHRRLHRMAIECGGSYKPSGAGGGDLGLVFSSEPEVVELVRGRAQAAGFQPLDLAVAPEGVRGRSNAPSISLSGNNLL
ncbi:MAG: mevalonate kinase [Thermoanaerobaculales bacterium]